MHEINDRTLCVLEINKVIVKNAYRTSGEKKLENIKKEVDKFNTMFDKRTREGLPSHWDIQGNLLSRETYETLLVEEKSKIDNTHEKTVVLKGTTIVNYLHKHFQLLWMVRTLFLDKPTYTKIIAFILEHHKLVHAPKKNVELRKKCRKWMSNLLYDTSAANDTKKTT